MNPTRLSRPAVAAAVLLVGMLIAGDSRGQEAPAPQPQASAATRQGPLVLEQVRDRWVIAPEAKVTDVDDGTAALVGGYGGVLFQGSVLLGAGVYTLPDGPNDTDMTYGGMVVGVLFGDERRFAYGVRGLVGFGTAELTSGIRFGMPSRPQPRAHGGSAWPTDRTTVTRDVRFDEAFMVFEPQVEAVLRLSDQWRISFGAGYRFTNASDYFDDRLRGATGTVAIVFGGSR